VRVRGAWSNPLESPPSEAVVAPVLQGLQRVGAVFCEALVGSAHSPKSSQSLNPKSCQRGPGTIIRLQDEAQRTCGCSLEDRQRFMYTRHVAYLPFSKQALGYLSPIQDDPRLRRRIRIAISDTERMLWLRRQHGQGQNRSVTPGPTVFTDEMGLCYFGNPSTPKSCDYQPQPGCI
jgi:hypothetical protein